MKSNNSDTAREELKLDEDESKAYNATASLLELEAAFMVPFPAVVSLRDLVENPLPEHQRGEEPPTSLLSPNKGHHALAFALEELEGLEKEEAGLMEHSPFTAPLTEIVTGQHASTPQDALGQLQEFGSIPRRVCQHPFKRNDIVWVCRSCQADETCVLCHSCFSQSDHEGHDVAFYHAQAGGCCDCGDPDAWDEAGFCPHHGPKAHSYNYSKATGAGSHANENNDEKDQFPLSSEQVRRVRGVVPAAVDWIVEKIAYHAEAGYQRAMLVRSSSNAEVNTTPMVNGWEAQSGEARLDLEMGDNSGHNLGQMMDADAEQDFVMQDGIFSPSAASRSSSRSFHDQDQDDQEAHGAPFVAHDNSLAPLSAGELGRIGKEGHGLYLVLFADDIHSPQQWIDALRDFLGASSYYTDSILAKFVRALRQYGQLVVWGTMELLTECGTTNAQLWMDGDAVAASRIANNLLIRARKLIKNGFFCSVVTRQELQLEQRAVAVLQWMSALARSCDPLCQTVAECVLPNRHLVPLLRADFKLSARITKAWYSLLLTLLAVPVFKSHLAAAYCDTYRAVTAKYAAGMGLLERSAYTLSVQFLNRVTYVVDLVQGRDLLGKLGKSLLETLKVAKDTNLNGRLNPNHFVLSHRRYSPCISDLKCVLNVKGMRRLFACQEGTFLQDWISTLSLAQFMDAQVWRTFSQGHIEDEVRGWVGAFNLSISLGSLFERLLSWEDEEPSPIKDPSSPLSRNLLTCMHLTHYILTEGVAKWQEKEAQFYLPTMYSTFKEEPYKRHSACLPFSTIASKHGCALAFQQLPIAQSSPFSFHLPLHRFLAACLRELCLRRDNGVEVLLEQVSSQVPKSTRDGLFRGLMEFPVLVLSRASQVRAHLWRRNGPGLNDQVLNYAEPPFCRSMRDADLLLLQFAVLNRNVHQSPEPRPKSDVGVSFLVHLLLHRLGIFDEAGLAKAPNSDINRYHDEIIKGLYPGELEADAPDNANVLPWTYTPARDGPTRLLLLEEFLHSIIIFAIELPPCPPINKNDHTNQAKQRLRREVIHKLASGRKTHSELSEVHLVLSHWDNVLLSEEGKLVNPDDATGAALGAILEDVADRKSSRGKMEPDKWELRYSAWKAYDPSFFHISLRSHQTAAESRPHASPASEASQGVFDDAQPYAPPSPQAHPVFERLRRDVTSDATVLAIVYRVLHLHCGQTTEKDVHELRGGKVAYENGERSETALARAVHILTLGAFAWQDAHAEDMEWRLRGGGSAGSIFFDREENRAPSGSDWVAAVFLSDPGKLLDSEWYQGGETALMLLRRLAIYGGTQGIFVAQDPSVRSGAAWLCQFADEHCSSAASHLEMPAVSKVGDSIDETTGSESELQRKKRLAKEKALARMKDQAAKFADMMKVELGDGEDGEHNNLSFANSNSEIFANLPQSSEIHNATQSASISSTRSLSSTSIETNGADSDFSFSQPQNSVASDPAPKMFDDSSIPCRLLKVRPQCIICSDDRNPAGIKPSYEEDVYRRTRRRKLDGGNALGFVAYVQPSTVLKGGGGPPSPDDSSMSPVRRFVGAHVALCGHAVHSECCEAYLATVSHREDRSIGKRDEFRCPLCQRLSNCLVPFIDVGEDWVSKPTALCTQDSPSVVTGKNGSDADMVCDQIDEASSVAEPLHNFLEVTPWWITRRNPDIVWDGQSAFVSRAVSHTPDEAKGMDVNAAEVSNNSLKPRRRSVRSLRKKDLYAAWNAMMRTPRFVRRKLRNKGPNDANSPSPRHEHCPNYCSDPEDTAGETVVWRRFMDQVCDIGYKADSKRLGEENLHIDFGEFRHYIVEKYTYNVAKRSAGIDHADWPSCVFSTTLSDIQKQELSREKLLAKLLMTIQSLAYSCSCEAFEARRQFRKHMLSSREVAGILPGKSGVDAVCSKFGISNVLCNGKLILLPHPSASVEDGSQPFRGRIGRLRYLALAVMAAAGAVAADLVQLTMAFPVYDWSEVNETYDMEVDKPDRAPIAYPMLLGNVLTHVVAAMCASCGRARARSDSLEVVWPVPFSHRGSFAFSSDCSGRKHVDCVIEDCEGFLKLGLLARILQVLLAKLDLAPSNIDAIVSTATTLRYVMDRHSTENVSTVERCWMFSCLSLLEAALDQRLPRAEGRNGDASNSKMTIFDVFYDACVIAAGAACSFLVDISTVLQVLLPGVMARYECQSAEMAGAEWGKDKSLESFEKLRVLFQIESVDEMLKSQLVREIVMDWFEKSHAHGKAATTSSDLSLPDASSSMRNRLFRTQGFRSFDWPMQSPLDWYGHNLAKSSSNPEKLSLKLAAAEPSGASFASNMQIETVQSPGNETLASEMLRRQCSPTLVTFSSKKTVPLIGGYRDEALAKGNSRPRVAIIPTSYTDLYAELGVLLPDCEQTAVCLVCGEVLNAGGKSECTRHSYKCGAGTGLFFLLQECSGLIMHKGKAAYIHSPYVDSHGETPQYRGRPLNLDLARYDHLREVWFGHAVRQQVLAERGSSRQVIVPDFY